MQNFSQQLIFIWLYKCIFEDYIYFKTISIEHYIVQALVKLTF